MGTALITVGNHASSMDDPGLLGKNWLPGAIAPWDICWNPWRMRWALATQEICFPDNKKIQAFMGVGKTLPIWRGGGIDQPLWHDASRLVGAGQWVHLFPEARVVQTGRLGLDPITVRSPETLARLGRLKWGVGKLIAHAPRHPVVVPFYHAGMAGILPQNNVWKTSSDGRRIFDNLVVPGGWKIFGIRGNKVRVWVGPALRFDDLLADHEARHGPLRKITSEPRANDWKAEMRRWVSTEEERQLYSAITRRIEEAMLALEAATDDDLEKNPDPAIRYYCERSRAACEDPASAPLPSLRRPT